MKASRQPFAELHEQTRARLGSILFTVLDWNASDRSFARLFSNRTDLSEPGVIKQGTVTADWLTSCIEGQEPFLSTSRADIAATYGEWQQLLRVGCGTSMNVPVVGSGGETVGVINTFAGDGAYDRQSLTTFHEIIDMRQVELADAISAAGNDLRRRLTG